MSAAKKTNIEHQDHPIDIEFVKPFIDGTINTMRTQASLEIKAQTPAWKSEYDQNIEILGIVSLVSRVYDGSISLCFPKGTFVKVCNRLFGENHSAISSEIEDAAGELLNMIYGAAKAKLNDKHNYQIPKALPSIVSGKKLTLTQSVGPTIVVPFTSELGPFHLEIEVTQKGSR